MKKALCLVFCLVIFTLSLSSCDILNIQDRKAEEESRLLAEAVEEYKEKAYTFYSKTLSSGSDMEDIGNEIEDAWYAFVKNTKYNGKRIDSVDSAISEAQSYMKKEIRAVESADSTIKSLYKELLVVPDTTDQFLLEIKEAVKQTYDAYRDMYECVMDPSGSYNTWPEEFGDTDSELADAIGDLRELLE